MIWIHEKLKKMREEKGFTLIELMVVVLIIAILIAIAIPTFLGARGRAQDRAAQSGARNTVTNAKAIYTDNEDYTDATIGVGGELTDAEPSLTFVAGNSLKAEAPNHVSVAGQTVDTFTASVASANGNNCWHIRDAVNPATNPGTWWKLTTTAGTCQAAAPGADVYDTNMADGATAGAWVRQPGDAAEA